MLHLTQQVPLYYVNLIVAYTKTNFPIPYLANVYIADQYNHRIRKVTVSTGIITTYAGSSTSSGYSGDDGSATYARLNYPIGVALDSTGTHLLSNSLIFLVVLSFLPSLPR